MKDSGNILVTGATGFLGSHVVERLRTQGFNVVATSRGTTRGGTVHMDVCDATSIDTVLRIAAPSRVIHCASYGVNYADQDPEQALAVNTYGSLNLLSASARRGIKRFVHIGSCFEYGHHEGRISEDAALKPTAIYGASKAAASILLRERARALGVDLIIARPFGIWGPHEPPFRVVPQVITACIERRPLKLTSCAVLRDYMYVEDVADRIVALTVVPELISERVVNIGTGEGVVLRDFVLSIARLLDGDSLMHFGELEHRPTEMTSLVADTRRLHDFLGDRPRTSLADGVRRMVMSLSQDEPST